MEAKTSIEGQSATLPCQIKAMNEVSAGGYVLEWHREEKGLIYSAHNQDSMGTMAVDYQGRLKHNGLSLIFTPLRVTDAGTYWCVVKPLRGLAGTVPTGKKVQLYVHAAPTFSKVSDSDVYKRFGETARLECLARGVPEPELVWKKDGMPLRARAGLAMGNSYLTINELQANDDGVYMCDVSNEAGSRNHVIRLHVSAGIRFIETAKNTSAVESSDVRFPCSADSPPNKVSYQWFFGEKELHAAGTLALRSRVEDGTLKIRRISKDDSGWYTCKVTDGTGSSTVSKTYLDVLYKPRVQSSTPVMQYVPLGLTGKVICKVDANPMHESVKWQKDGVKIEYVLEENKTDQRYTAEESGAILKITQVASSDSGEYTCQPSNSLGDGLPFEIRVSVTKSPVFDSIPTPKSDRIVGQPWSVACSARMPAGSNDQEMEIFWRRKDGTRVPSAKNGRFVIDSVTEFDHGCYDCVVRTVAIELTKESCLRVIGIVPRAPEQLTVSTGAYDATLRWKAGYDGGTNSDQYFLAKYRPRPSSTTGTIHWHTVNASTSIHLTLTNLLPSTDYEFYVEPRNRLGPGVPSPTVTERTKGDNVEDLFIVPTDKPGGVTYFPNFGTQSIGPRPAAPHLTFTSEYPSLILSWKLPQSSNRKQLPVHYYSLEYKQAEEHQNRAGAGQQHRTNTNEGNIFKILAQRVFDQQYRLIVNRPPFMAGKTFDVRVKAHSVASFSEPSNLVSFTVPGVPSQTALISGIAGGVAFLFLCLILAMMAIRCAKRRNSHRHTRPMKHHQNHGHKNQTSLILANGKHREDSTTDDTGGMAEWSLHGGLDGGGSDDVSSQQGITSMTINRAFSISLTSDHGIDPKEENGKDGGRMWSTRTSISVTAAVVYPSLSPSPIPCIDHRSVQDTAIPPDDIALVDAPGSSSSTELNDASHSNSHLVLATEDGCTNEKWKGNYFNRYDRNRLMEAIEACRSSRHLRCPSYADKAARALEIRNMFSSMRKSKWFSYRSHVTNGERDGELESAEEIDRQLEGAQDCDLEGANAKCDMDLRDANNDDDEKENEERPTGDTSSDASVSNEDNSIVSPYATPHSLRV